MTISPFLVVTGCKESPAPASGLGKKGMPSRIDGFIAFVAAGQDDPLWPVIRAGADRYRADSGAFPVRYFVPKGDTPQDQNALLASLNDRNLRGVCVHVRDAAAIEPSLRALHDSGTVVVSIGVPASAELRAAHVGFDNAAIGRMLADAVAATLADEGSIMLMHAGLKDPIYGPRLWAFRDRIRLHARIEVLAEIDCAADAAECALRMQETSRRYPRLSAWVCLGDWPIRQMSDPTPAALGLPAHCKFVTFGGWPAHWPLIAAGAMPVVLTVDDGDFGGKALLFCESAILSKNPKQFEDRYDVPLRLLRAEDLEAWKRQWLVWSTMADVAPTATLSEPAQP